MSMPTFSLDQLGWRPTYSQQLTISDLETAYPARVAAVHRNGLEVLCERGELSVVVPRGLAADDTGTTVTVGDWVLVEAQADRVVRVLQPSSLLARISAGGEHRTQAIAANLDTLFVVTSCNEDCNPSRLERYLSLAYEVRLEAVIVLTKADLCREPEGYAEPLRHVAKRATVVTVDATSIDDCKRLTPWLERGQTVAFVGSSGVGKSTLINTLTNANVQATAGIREDDSKGRHTTTTRQLIALPSGAWVIDTPGMRELRIGASETGVSEVFADLEALAQACRFRDCMHAKDQGCALHAAVAAGQLDERRLRSYLKLRREAANAARTVHERRERERQFGRLCRDVLRHRRRLRGGDG